jgi:hypothetical protein
MANGWDTSTGETGDYANDPAYQALFQQILGNTSPNGVWDYNKTNSTLTDQGQQFAAMYQNLTGQAPTSDVMNSFYSNIGTGILNSPGGESGSNYASDQALITPYIQNTYGPQITANQTAQQNTALAGTQATDQNLVNQMNTNTQDFLTSPQSTQAIEGNLNNSGMLNSGGYTNDLASLMSQGALQNQNSVLQGVTIPASNNLLSTLSSPYGQTVQNSNSNLTGYGGTQNGIQNFDMESSLAQLLASQGQPSSLQSILGLATGSAGGAGSLLSGGAQAYKATWICTAMQRDGVLMKSEVTRLHDHLFPAFWPRFWKFMGYFVFGKLLVLAANSVGVDWSVCRPMFYDRVIAEPDSVKALDLYESAFWSLVHEVRGKMTLCYHRGTP